MCQDALPDLHKLQPIRFLYTSTNLNMPITCNAVILTTTHILACGVIKSINRRVYSRRNPMPTLWKRFGLAAALAAQIGLLPQISFAQQPQTKCGTIQPCPPIGSPGHAHVGPAPLVSPSPEPPKWTPTNPAPIPTPSPMTDPMTPTPPVPPPSPMTPTPPVPTPSPMTDPMGTPQTDPMGTPQENTPPVQTPPTAPDFSAPPGDSLGFNAADAGIGSPDAAFNAPNMMGDLLKGFRSVSFQYNGAGDFAPVLSAGATTLRNNKVSENNSAVPRTRVSFRYNYFHNANSVQGFQRGPQTREVENFAEFGQPPIFNPIPVPASKTLTLISIH